VAGKSYGQFCGLARALDVVGDRWNLLIVRELLIGPARFGQLRAGLPTIATNLLAERLKDLEGHGVIERRLADDGNAIAYALTPWGQQLREPVDGLIRWSTPVMRRGRCDDSFDPRWLVPALHALLADRRAPTPTTLVLLVDGIHMQVTVDGDGPHVRILDEVPGGAAVLRASAETVLALAAGAITPTHAVAVCENTADQATIDTVLGPATTR
jgi:DNA-binding HxlR family transcriptional regulator